MLIVNLSYVPEDLNSFVGKLSTNDNILILDFTSSYAKNEKHKVIFPSDIDNDNKYHQVAINNYIEQLGLVSQTAVKGTVDKNIRDYKLDDLSIYWLTEISEKHPQNCILKNLYYLKHIYKSLNYSGTDVAFILPVGNSHYISAIRSYFTQNINTVKNIIFNREQPPILSLRTQISYLRNFYSKLRKLLRSFSNTVNSNLDYGNVIFTYFPQTWQELQKRDSVLGDIFDYTQKTGRKTAYVPFYFNYYSIGNFNENKFWDTRLVSSFPGAFKRIFFAVEVAFLIRKIKHVKFSCEDYSFVDSDVLRIELLNLLTNKLEFLFNYVWLKQYFKTIDVKTNIFYQDELYVQGRIISAAAKMSGNHTITTYGVQHGIFYQAHTVYSITNNELNDKGKKDGLPFPDKFIVWGDYFKKHFLKCNSLNEINLIVAGNPKYCLVNKPILNRKLITNEGLVILWCTTLKVDAINQFNTIISKYLEANDGVILKIRCHPLFDLENYLVGIINKKIEHKIKFSKASNIYEDISESDIVLTSSGSTVFLDAMYMNKPVLSFINNDYYMGDLGESEMTRITGLNDFVNSINEIKSGVIKKYNYENLLETRNAEWHNLLS